jgi:hypothetical protein
MGMWVAKYTRNVHRRAEGMPPLLLLAPRLGGILSRGPGTMEQYLSLDTCASKWASMKP